MNEIQDKRQVTAVFLGMGNKGYKTILKTLPEDLIGIAPDFTRWIVL
jgi:hypothetical protein